MADIFVSYAREDSAFAARVIERLRDNRLTVFWDQHINVGKDWEYRLEAELRLAKCVVVVWSPHSVVSDWVRAEAHEGRGRHILVPIAIDGTQPPLIFRRMQTIQLSHSEDEEVLASGLDQLSAATHTVLSESRSSETTMVDEVEQAREQIERLMAPTDAIAYLYDPMSPEFTCLIRSSQKAVLIGRGTACDIVLNDETISRSHCEISIHLDAVSWPHERFELKQVAMNNTTVVNGTTLDRAWLKHQDLIKIGPRTLVFCLWFWSFKIEGDLKSRKRNHYELARMELLSLYR